MKKILLGLTIFSLLPFVACSSIAQKTEDAKAKLTNTLESTKEKMIQDAKDAVNNKVENTIDDMQNKTEEKIDNKFKSIKQDLTF